MSFAYATVQEELAARVETLRKSAKNARDEAKALADRGAAEVANAAHADRLADEYEALSISGQSLSDLVRGALAKKEPE